MNLVKEPLVTKSGAKLLLFFDICKYFLKKVKKWCFFDVEGEREWYKNGIRMVLQWYYNGITQ